MLREENEKDMDMERCIIEHCSPTLASIKTANLFGYCYADEEILEQEIIRWNGVFVQKGIALRVLNKKDGRALVYVYRLRMLREALADEDVLEFLSYFGYGDLDLDGMIIHLSERIAEADGFPHEIGVFLDYPLEDVIGFILNHGRNSKCAGCWKVYGDACKACEIFARYKKCKEVYGRLWEMGRSIQKLTVAF